MDRRGIIIRRDGDHPCAVVARLGDVMVVGDVGVGGIAAPEQHRVGVKPIFRRVGEHDFPQRHRRALMIVADLDVLARQRRTERLEESVQPHALAALAVNARAAALNDRFRPVAGENVEKRIGDLRERLIPTDPLPASATALAGPFQWILDPRRIVHPVRVAGAFLATARIGVRHGWIVGRRIVRGLLLAQRDAVLDVDVKITGPAVPAIGEMRRLHHPIPLPGSLSQRF